MEAPLIDQFDRRCRRLAQVSPAKICEAMAI